MAVAVGSQGPYQGYLQGSKSAAYQIEMERKLIPKY